jgi:hypothetical protein
MPVNPQNSPEGVALSTLEANTLGVILKAFNFKVIV